MLEDLKHWLLLTMVAVVVAVGPLAGRIGAYCTVFILGVSEKPLALSVSEELPLLGVSEELLLGVSEELHARTQCV